MSSTTIGGGHQASWRVLAGSLLALALVTALWSDAADAYMAIIPKVKTINGKCIHPMYNEKILAGQSFYPPGVCEEHTCDPSKRSITITGCGKVMAPPGCKAVYDRSLRHPDCCMPTLLCDGHGLDENIVRGTTRNDLFE